jgi:short-subunit dehydrogenase
MSCHPWRCDFTETGRSDKASRRKLGLRARARPEKVSGRQGPRLLVDPEKRLLDPTPPDPDRSLKRAAVVTGASSGIGLALAKALAAEGYRVGLVARRRAPMEEAAKEILASGGTAAVATADVGDLPQLRRAIDDLARVHGPADLLIANAGVGVPTTLDPVNIDAVEETFRVNVLGVVYAIDAVLPAMLARGSGHIVAVSSLAGYKGLPGESAYCASKAAVNSYMEGLRVQVRTRGIAVTTVCPGFVHTPMTSPNTFKMPFVLEADDAAARIIRALRRRPKVYNFPWPMAVVMRLSRLAPDWLVARLFQDYLQHPPMPITPSPARSD